jgi:hypothetical protein
MRLVGLLLLVPVAPGCSSASSVPSSTASEDDASPGDTPDGSTGDALASGGDAASLEAGDAGMSSPGVQTCAACTASDCLSALESCGKSHACLDALQEFNACYGSEVTAGNACGGKLASTGSAASALWSCMSSKCRPSCGVAPNDWRGFFDARIYRIAPQVPLGGIEGAGYKVVYSPKKPELVGLWEKAFKYASYWESLGLSLSEENVVRDVLAGGPANKAGVVAGMKVLAVDGHKYSAEVMKDALARAKASSAPIALLTESNEFYETHAVDWHGGERYRVLGRDPSKPDRLEKILAPRVPAPSMK